MSRVLNDTEHMQRIFVDGLEEIITAGLTLIGIMAVLFWLNWKLALLALVPIPLLVLGAIAFTKRIHKYYRKIRKGSAELNALLQDTLAGIRETMGFNRQPYEEDRFGRKSNQCRKDTLKAMYLWSYYSPGMMLAGSLGAALVLWNGTHEVLGQRLSVGELVMGTLLDHTAMLQHNDPVHPVNGRKPMGDDNRRPVFGELLQRFSNLYFRLGVDVGRRFVEHDNRRIF